MVNNLDISTAVPHLVGLLTIPSPTQNIFPRLVGNVHLIHDRKLVLARIAWAQVSLGELIESRLKHCSGWAVRSCSAMDRPLLRHACRDGIGSPLSSIRCNISACHNLLVGLRVIIPMNGRVTFECECV